VTIAVLLLVSVLGLVIVAAAQQHQDYVKKINAMRWVDEREKFFIKIANEAQNIRSLGAIQHIGQIDGMYTNRFGSNGPKTFMPSQTGMQQIALAMNILEERENLMQQIRDGVVRAYSELAVWEKTHPMPDLGMPYDAPPRPVKMPPPKQNTKPVPKAFLEALNNTPIYDPNRKALNR
jgi:hypothetical protein